MSIYGLCTFVDVIGLSVHNLYLVVYPYLNSTCSSLSVPKLDLQNLLVANV